MKKTLVLSLMLSGVALAAPDAATTWDKDNDPARFASDYEYRLSALPTKSVLPNNKTPWSSSYWPRFKGSINYRWNTPNPIGYKLNSPSRARVLTMSLEELAKLSPAEKFDLVQGHYDYPLSKAVEKGSDPKAKDYEGVCDGWTAAAIQFTEPAAVVIKNPEGIEIPFGSSDVKALMSYDVSINAKPGSLGSTFVGGYCKSPWGMKLGTANCQDINPGAFHVIAANQIGIKKQSFAVDIDPKHETWNQPVYGFEYEVRGKTDAEGAASAYIVHAKFSYAEDDPDAPHANKVFSWDPTVGTVNFAGETREYDYVLYLDYSGRIIGGKWIGDSKMNHPDMFWISRNKIEWTERFKILETIYRPSLIE